MGQFSVVLMIHNEQAGLSLSSPQFIKKFAIFWAELQLVSEPGSSNSGPSALTMIQQATDEG